MKKLILTAALSLLLLAGCMTADVTSDINDMQTETQTILDETKARADEMLKIDETLANDVIEPVKHSITDTTPPESEPIEEPVQPTDNQVDESAMLCDGVPLNVYQLTDEEKSAYFDLTLKLFRGSADPTEEKNMMISPLSVMTALGMTANGAQNNTLTQIEDALGLDLDTLNTMLSLYLSTLPNGEKYKLTAANSIWYRETDALSIVPEFLTKNQELFNAEVLGEAFDLETCKAINEWVSENTDGMISQMLDEEEELPETAMLYLINALAFNADWQHEYTEDRVSDGVFTSFSGEEQNVTLMHSFESSYISSDDAKGFLKFYQDRKYAFVALLPNEGISLDDYIASLTTEKLMDMLKTERSADVTAALPKFESKFSVNMNDMLIGMGMTDLFDDKLCDISGMAKHDIMNLYISRVLHSTFISVDEKGTKAAAVTAIEAGVEESIPEQIEIILDRPFVYMIVEWKNRLPIFIGTVETLGE